MSLSNVETVDLLAELAKRREVGIVSIDRFSRGVIWWGIDVDGDEMERLVEGSK